MTENNVESVETDVWTDKNNVKPADNDVKTAVKCRALSAMDTLRSFKRCGAKGVYRQMSYQGQSAFLYRLLTQTIEASKKRTVKSDNHIKRKKWKKR